MHKWYEDRECSEGVVIGGQVCLVRNISGYSFESRMDPQDQEELREKVFEAVREEESRLGLYFEERDLSDLSGCSRTSLIGRLAIPPLMLGTSEKVGLLLTPDEAVSILVNGTEHICIQVSCPGKHISQAYETAQRVDDALNAHLAYAFSDRYGYLTASPLYTGTGLMASYLLHLPYLERSSLTGTYSKELARFGFTLRGHFHGSSSAPGQIYRIKNSRTLGMSEIELIASLERLTDQISSSAEQTRSERDKAQAEIETDQTYRAYGLLKYARELDFDETLEYLSYVRSGCQNHIWDCSGDMDIFSLMIGMQDAVLISGHGEEEEGEKADVRRARYIRRLLPGLEA